MKNDPYQRYASDKLAFYIAASDHEILNQVNRLMSRTGCIGLMDTAGRLHYLIDGRRGSPYAVRRIQEMTGRLLRDKLDEHEPLLLTLARAVDMVLDRQRLRPELKGCRYLRYMLLQAGLDENLLRPVSKTLYPAAATHFKVSVSQVERDVRYALRKTRLHEEGLTAAAAICRLHDEMMRLAEEIMAKETFPAALDDRERY